MAVHYNIGGEQHCYLGLVFSPTSYSLITITPFVCQLNPGNLIIPIAGTHNAQE